ncbi:PRTRC system protein C [Paludibacter sp. 221]|uniref:M60 family metallopeptidase n=1 Tax=Paludibacter sp. 221 TaxID=2302939 RepID=UPI0013D5A1F5|nr:M60 family metallopeptidase [Paludibacter sp. 221]NDV47391.1 PRTRC system protein C [Paludibacter sp. 221]
MCKKLVILSLVIMAMNTAFSQEKVYNNIFADNLYSELSPKIKSSKQIAKINNPLFRDAALQMLDKTYPVEYRVQAYDAYPKLETTAKNLKLSGYNRYENPTGVFFDSDSEAIIMVGNTAGESLSLCVNNFEANTNDSYPLKEGYNSFKIKNAGLAYISYYTDNYKELEPVKIHILGGKVNGYFDKSKHTNDDWKRILDNTVFNYIDIKGHYINLCYTVDDLAKYCQNGIYLINYYDKVVELEYDLMGLFKYNKVPKNHMFARTTKGGLFADGIGAGFAKGYMRELANPDKIFNGTWAIAHELGHVNQIRPGLKWVSTTEVTNNVYSAYIQHFYTPHNLRLEHERINDGDGNNVVGGRFNAYLNYGVVKGEQWLCQRGPDRMKDYQNGGDHFVKLCPLWQLMLYYRVANDTPWRKPDWYGDVAEIVRNTNEKNLSNGQLQLNFMKNVCDAVKEDLTDFFVKAGMLKPIDKELDDYTRGWLKITQEECDNLIEYAKKYPKPVSPVINYLTGNSVEAFERQLPVLGTYNEGVEFNSEKRYCVIDHKVWKNATVFETYVNDTLEKVAMVGTDSPDCTSTLVRYPEGATRIEAVAWDGTRTLVYGAR